MLTCNIVFWAVIIPIMSFGCELWILSDKDKENIMAFERMAGRRIQRFQKRSLNLTSFYGLGWIRLTSFIMVKKLLFVLTILRMKVDNVVRRILVHRAIEYQRNPGKCRENKYNSPISDILNAAYRLGLLNTVFAMINGTKDIYGKSRWSEYVWAQAWKLDDAYWCSIFTINNDCKYLHSTIGVTKYLTWWSISDKFPNMLRWCENLAKIVWKSSLLRVDDFRLKDSLHSDKVCALCDNYSIENIEHIVMQCPFFEKYRVDLYKKIDLLDPIF